MGREMYGLFSKREGLSQEAFGIGEEMDVPY